MSRSLMNAASNRSTTISAHKRARTGAGASPPDRRLLSCRTGPVRGTHAASGARAWDSPVVRTGCIVAGLARRTGCKGLSNGCLASSTRPRQSTLNIERRTRALPGHSARKDRVSKADMLGRSAHGKLWVVSGPSALRLADARDQGEPIARNRCHYCFWLFLPGAGRWRKEC
jgi:hypothetical protein